MTRSGKFWAAAILLLIIIIVAGGMVIWSKHNQNQPVEISLSPQPEINGRIGLNQDHARLYETKGRVSHIKGFRLSDRPGLSDTASIRGWINSKYDGAERIT